MLQNQNFHSEEEVMDGDLIKFVPQDANYFIRKQIKEDKHRKDKEWEETKSCLEDKMAANMMKRKERLTMEGKTHVIQVRRHLKRLNPLSTPKVPIGKIGWRWKDKRSI